MKATADAIARERIHHRVEVRDHQLTVDEPPEHGGDDDGPSPQELLAAQPRVVHRGDDGDVRQAQGLGHRTGRGPVSSTRPPSAAARPSSSSCCASARPAREEQIERLRVIAAKCPVHRTLDGEVMFDERIEIV